MKDELRKLIDDMRCSARLARRDRCFSEGGSLDSYAGRVEALLARAEEPEQACTGRFGCPCPRHFQSPLLEPEQAAREPMVPAERLDALMCFIVDLCESHMAEIAPKYHMRAARHCHEARQALDRAEGKEPSDDHDPE